METSPHPVATEHLPSFITAPGETDVLMVVMVVVLAFSVLGFGVFFFRLHSLPEQIAHKSQKMQAELVAVLCLISLFTHMHIFWIAGLVLAMLELPDFGTPLSRIAGSAEKLAGLEPGEGATKMAPPRAVQAHHDSPDLVPGHVDAPAKHGGETVVVPAVRPEPMASKPRERIHA
jgi:hypothetical protein